ncbi:MAG: hypothetical protein CL869_02560 [Cytophagia bacterium]|nr:hypothetical protein [Cytophagia bacterium]
MRIINSFIKENIKVTIFDFDLKYVIKFEFGSLEQTYKVDKLEFTNHLDLEEKIDQNFIKSVNKRFDRMSKDLSCLYM